MDLFFIDVLKITSKDMNFESNVNYYIPVHDDWTVQTNDCDLT